MAVVPRFVGYDFHLKPSAKHAQALISIAAKRKPHMVRGSKIACSGRFGESWLATFAYRA
jgi:hypothetical protein